MADELADLRKTVEALQKEVARLSGEFQHHRPLLVFLSVTIYIRIKTRRRSASSNMHMATT
jgi:hypothetical protein